MAQTKMATATEVEGETTVSVPEEVEEALSQEPDPESENETPSEEETPKDEETPKEEEKSQLEEEVKELSPRGQKRVGKLIDKLKDRTVENSALKQALESNSQEQVQPQVRAPWETEPQLNIPEPGSEISPEDYARNVAATADQIVNMRIGAFASNMKRAETLDRDRQDLESEYEILNPSSEEYDPEVSKKVANLFMEAQKSNPDLRLKKYVGDIMSLHQAGQIQGKEEVTPKLIRQQGEAAVTPSGASQKSKVTVDDWENLSYKEKEQWLRENGAWD